MIRYECSDRDSSYPYSKGGRVYLSHPSDIQLEGLLSECNDRYAYWTDVKYKYKGIELPLTPLLLWGYLKRHRRAAGVSIYPRYGLRLFVTPQMQG